MTFTREIDEVEQFWYAFDTRNYSWAFYLSITDY